LGVTFDGWQDGAGTLVLGRDKAGVLAATVGGVGMSIPRQVGKTYLFAGLLFGLCVEKPGLAVLWTSHHDKTTGETFLVMQAFADRPQVKPYVKQIFLGAGTWEIRFRNGSRILFGARERGFGRGMSNIDVLIFDEAQILSERALQNMLAAMNRSTFGLHCYVGTPPKPGDNCEVFTRMRSEALAALESGEPADLIWIEMGADDDADLDDHAQYLKANASYPHYTPEASIKRLRKKLDPDGFRREALGIWDSSTWTVFDVARWVSLEDTSAVAPPRVVLVVDVSPYRLGATIAVAGNGPARGGQRTTLVMVFALPVEAVVPKVVELVAERDIVEVVLTAGEARGLAADLTLARVEFRKLVPGDIAASCTAFQTAVADGTVTHCGQNELDVAVANARTRRSGDAETWDRGFETDVSAVVAAAAALHVWGLQELVTVYPNLESVW
jgi:phage terminase large subunit-like protein